MNEKNERVMKEASSTRRRVKAASSTRFFPLRYYVPFCTM